MKKLSQYYPDTSLVLDQKASSQAGTVLVPLYELVTVPGLTATSTSQTAFVMDNAAGSQQYQIAAVSARFGTASTSGTLQVEVAGAAVAVGSGTNQLTGTVSLAGTANTTVNGTVIASPTAITAGTAVNIILAGTLTSLANCAVTIVLQRIA